MLEFWQNRGNLLHKLAKKRHGARTVVLTRDVSTYGGATVSVTPEAYN